MAMVRPLAQTQGDQDRVSSHRSFFHAFAVTAMAAALHTWSVDYKQGVAIASPNVIFPTGDELTPDVVWISLHRLRDRGLDREGNLRQTPRVGCGSAHTWQDECVAGP